ncbi:hypothetical protein BV25DRAFT_1895666 [Artomyces pyxidatus]|uniref:Uncharacterized protein n=1 Tax=Artomyces pyxidatus TaxID=48021 RepID=A0ACB8SEV2_9AGAM|nr:hypothetical protein BV25DRAFT_1895666 [Artomyces pyxidatus]
MLIAPGPEPLVSTFDHSSPSVKVAYQVCYRAEQHLLELQKQDSSKELDKKLINIRVLAHLLSYGPSDAAIAHVSRVILGCEDIEALATEGQRYDDHFLRPFRKQRGQTPVPSHDSSRPSYDARRQDIEADMQRDMQKYKSPDDHSQAKISALLRDDFRCIVTRKRELSHWQPGGPAACLTRCCHIFAESTNQQFTDANKLHNTTSIWTVLEMFGYESILDELAGAKVHCLQNILTMDITIHHLFDSMEFWFEATDIPHQYDVVSAREVTFGGLGVPHSVKFCSSHTDLPLPDPTYLRIHASCCRVAHTSGAVAYYEFVEHEEELSEWNDPVPADSLAARLYEVKIRQSSSPCCNMNTSLV